MEDIEKISWFTFSEKVETFPIVLALGFWNALEFGTSFVRFTEI